MATVLPPFTTLSSYPGIYTDQPSDTPDTTDIPQPDSEAEFFEGAQSIINEAYGDVIRAWGNAIMANAVSMDDVPEFLREQVQGYIDYTTGQTEEVAEPEETFEEVVEPVEEVVDVLSGDADLENGGPLFDAPQPRTPTGEWQWNAEAQDYEWVEGVNDPLPVLSGTGEYQWNTDSEEWEWVDEGGLISTEELTLPENEDIWQQVQGALGGVLEKAGEAPSAVLDIIKKSIPGIDDLPGGKDWVPPGTIIGVRVEPVVTGSDETGFKKTLILAIPGLPGSPAEIPLTKEDGTWLPVFGEEGEASIAGGIIDAATKPLKDVKDAVISAAEEIGNIWSSEDAGIIEKVGSIIGAPWEILSGILTPDAASSWLKDLIVGEIQSGLISTPDRAGDLDDVTEEPTGDVTEDTSGVSTEDVSGAEDDSGDLGLGSEEDDDTTDDDLISATATDDLTTSTVTPEVVRPPEITTSDPLPPGTITSVEPEIGPETIYPDDDGYIPGVEPIIKIDGLSDDVDYPDNNYEVIEEPPGVEPIPETTIFDILLPSGPDDDAFVPEIRTDPIIIVDPIRNPEPEPEPEPEITFVNTSPPGTDDVFIPEITQDPIIIVDPIRNPEPEPEPEPPPETLFGFIDPQPDPDPVIEVYESVIPCFVSGTKIDMADGTQKNIEDVLVGDKVQAIGGKIDTVSYVHDIPVQDHVLWTLNGRITATEAHPFLTTKGWKSANPEASAPIYESYGIAIGKLEVGDILVGSSGNVELSSLESKEERVKVYNFTTESTHTYMVDGVVSHNKSIPPPPIITSTPLPPLPPEDFEPEITQDPIIVEPPITEPEPEPEPEPPPIVEPPPPPPSSGGGGMLGGTPRAYMADLPYQLPRFMGVPYDPGDPVEQLNRIILEGLFSK